MENIRNLGPAVKVDRTTIINLEKGKLPPQAIDLEESILGAMMLDSSGTDDALLLLKSGDVFYKDAHKNIFDAMQMLHVKNEPVDLLTVSAQLKTMGLLEKSGGDFYLVQLTQKISSAAHIEFHCRIVQQAWVKRRMIKSASEVIELAYDESTDIFDLTGRVSADLDNVLENIDTGRTDMSLPAALQNIKQRVELLSSKKETNELSGAHTGFRKVDAITGGWQPSDLIIIAARPGMGKTSLVMKCLLENVKHGNAVGFISLEMSTQQLVTRMVACDSHFHLNQLFRTGFEHAKYWEQFMALEQRMQAYGAHFDDKSVELTEVLSKARLWKRKHNIKILIVDYLQLMSYGPHKKSGNREQEISTISRQLKKLAKELNIPILLLSQLSREVEKRADKRPMLSDLRESGAIEQDADVVGFIYRPAYYKLEPEPEMIAMGANAEFIIAKHRNGSLDRKGLYFDENKTKFMDPEDMEEIATHDAVMHNEAAGPAYTPKPLPTPSANEAFGGPVANDKPNNDVPF